MPDPAADSVQLPVEGTGKKVDTYKIVRDDGTVVERQAVVLTDSAEPTASQVVTGEQDRGHADVLDRNVVQAIDDLREIVEELKELVEEFVNQ